MTKTFIIILCISALFTVISTVLERRRLRAYWDRVCTGAQWRRRFPQATKDEIRKFLNVFIEAFGFRKSRRLCFSPDDKIMEVYRALYPPKWSIGDSMELEDLSMSMERTYGIDIFAVWREDITFGELFAFAQPKHDKACE